MKSLYFVQVLVKKFDGRRVWACLGEDFRPAKSWRRTAMFQSRQSALLGLLDWLQNGRPGAEKTLDYRVLHSFEGDATATTEKGFFGLVGIAYVAPSQWKKQCPKTKVEFVAWLVLELGLDSQERKGTA
jgi:hypothetical protein